MRPVKTFLLAAALAGAAVPVLAQGPPPGGGGFNRAAFMKFREQHKYTFQLMTTTSRGLMECERTPQTRVKPDQAKKNSTKPIRGSVPWIAAARAYLAPDVRSTSDAASIEPRLNSVSVRPATAAPSPAQNSETPRITPTARKRL